ncbi:MAG TPA: preprotein translocase subunit SecA, partial [Bacteroidales bacterium]|nr:preprotein translocase subunit SecA [Bacteroidales bacterium]
MLSIIKKFLGTKSEKDIKALNPILEKIKAVYPEIEKLDNDALRARTLNFKQRIAEAVAEKQQAILDLKASIEDDQQLDMDEKEKVYQSIDQLDNESYQIVQEVLNDLLPEAFAVMKETARRFKENETIEVTATDFDRNLAATHAHVDIIGDKAYFHNKWVAGGSTITWDMVHYD